MNWKQPTCLLKGIVLLIGVIIFGGAIYFANYDRLTTEYNTNSLLDFETATVIQILEDHTFIDSNYPEIVQGSVTVELEILTGPYKGEIVEATQYLTRLVNVRFNEGDRVSVRISTLDEELVSVAFDSFERREVLIACILIFFLTLAIIGGKRGLMSVASLIFTLSCIIFLLIPLMLKGYPAILTTIVILSVVAFVTLLLLFGITSKMIISLLGCVVGVVSAAVIATVVGNMIYISGFNMENTDQLLVLVDINEYSLQPHGLFISGILIATLGAVMDTAVSIASAMEEIQLTNPHIGFKQLFKSGMNIGRDVMGTMSNTLILAFAGTALNMIIIIYVSQLSFNQIINTDFIALEIIRGVAGSLGIILTVPAVAFMGAKRYTKKSSR